MKIQDVKIKEEKDWRALKINSILEFELVGIISKISTILANNQISIFVLSTYNTDYILVKKNKIEETISLLENNGYQITKE